MLLLLPIVIELTLLSAYQGGRFACNSVKVKVKLVKEEDAAVLQRELNTLLQLNNQSTCFVKVLHHCLISSEEFTVSDSSADSAMDLRFDRHVGMVMEPGEITLTDFLIHNCRDISQGKLIDIITGLVCIVSDAHFLNYVLMDIKDQNTMQFRVGRGNYTWKGIDLDSALEKDTLLSATSFMATVRFMAPELLTRREVRARQSMDIWSLGVLIFNVLLCKQRETFWSLLGIHGDAAIEEEVLQGRLTQKKVDDLIERTFQGSDNSSQKHFLQRMLRIEPSERCTIQVLHDAALLKGTSSFSASRLYRGQQQLLKGQQEILGEVKSLRETFETQLTSLKTTFETVLEDDSGMDLRDCSSYLESFQAVLTSQLQSAADLRAITESLSQWKSPVDATMPPAFMSLVTTQLQELLSAASDQRIDAANSQELIRHLSSEVSGVQEQVKVFRIEIAALQDSFMQFGECVRKELAENSEKHALVLERLDSIDRTATAIVQEQTAAREEAERLMHEAGFLTASL